MFWARCFPKNSVHNERSLQPIKGPLMNLQRKNSGEPIEFVSHSPGEHDAVTAQHYSYQWLIETTQHHQTGTSLTIHRSHCWNKQLVERTVRNTVGSANLHIFWCRVAEWTGQPLWRAAGWLWTSRREEHESLTAVMTPLREEHDALTVLHYSHQWFIELLETLNTLKGWDKPPSVDASWC